MHKWETKYRFEQMADESKTVKLYIYDDVTAYGDFNWNTWKYDESETSANYFRQQLSEIPDDAEIELHVNSNGGSVKEGVAIYNMLKQHNAHKTCYVDGFAYSIASVICLACDHIIMGTGTSMLIHNMAMNVYGNATTLRKCADDLDVLMESNRKIYMERAKNVTEEELAEMMDKETFLTPEQCLQYGFCDEIGTQKADENLIAANAQQNVLQLRQQINAIQSFKEEMKQYAQIMTPKEPENKRNQKVLAVMSAFFNAFNKGGEQ